MTSMGFTPYDDAQPGSPSDAPVTEPRVVQEESPMDAARSPLDTERSAATLSDRDRGILEFERQWWKYAGAKEQAIRDLFDMSGTRYYQLLNGLIDTPEALAFDPMLVKRLRRMRSSRQRARSARRLGIEL
jgi:hypothetical protein